MSEEVGEWKETTNTKIRTLLTTLKDETELSQKKLIIGDIAILVNFLQKRNPSKQDILSTMNFINNMSSNNSNAVFDENLQHLQLVLNP